MSGPKHTKKHEHSQRRKALYTSEFLDSLDYSEFQLWGYPGDPNYDPDQDEGGTKQVSFIEPAPIPRGASLQTAWTIYQRCETDWNQSAACVELKKTFTSQIMRANAPLITKCICFCLASPTTCGRSNVCMYQLAAFKTVVDLLSTVQSQPPRAFAQDPLFNTLDKQLLDHLSISVVNHPVGFHHIDPSTFVFVLRGTHVVSRGVLDRSPAIYMGDADFRTYRDPKTGQLSCHQKTSFPEDHPELRKLSPKQIAEKKRHSAVMGALILERFKRGKEFAKLPDLRGGPSGGWVLHDVHLYWRPSSVRV